MYSLQELEAMNPAEAIKIAEDMGMKKAGSSDLEEVRYYILDNQASATAKEEASKVANRAANKTERRGRKKTVKQEDEGAAAAAVTKDAASETPVMPKKRGRKSKAQIEAEKALQAQAEGAANEDGKQEVKAQTEEVPQPKKRGRKPKQPTAEAAEPAAETTVNAQSAAQTTAQAAETPATAKNSTKGENKGRGKKNAIAQAERKEEQKDQAAAVQQETAPKQEGEHKKIFTPKGNKSDNSLDSFFGNMKGRTFMPRGHQEKTDVEKPKAKEEEKEKQPAAQQRQQAPQLPQTVQQPLAPQQPILIHEPGANSQQAKQQFPKNMSKRQRQQLQRQQQQNNLARFPIEMEGLLSVYGVLEIMPEGYGFLRSSDFNYLASPDDIYITQQQIKQYGLRTGDVVEASVRPPLIDEKYYPMVKPITINGLDPSMIRDRARFEHLVPLFPNEKFNITKGRNANISTRIVDMFAPIGKGQRALIVAPPKTGKTILLKDIANAISENHPETYIIMLLIDERPEEVTDMSRSVNAEVIASTFDEPAERHVKIAGIVLEKAKRLVESGHDVVIMLDSITRLARAYNTVSPASGKILSGGVDANALQRPKRFFGAARNIEGGGSLTIIATALTETSSKMDEVIFEEFKGTGNMELQLDRKLSNKRVFPAVDIVASSTRRDDLLLPEETLNRMWILRNYLGDMNSLEAMEFIKKRMEMTRSNEELLVTMDK